MAAVAVYYPAVFCEKLLLFVAPLVPVRLYPHRDEVVLSRWITGSSSAASECLVARAPWMLVPVVRTGRKKV